MGPVVELRAQLRAQNDELSMALTHLLPLLAPLLILPRPVIPADRPSAPTLSQDPGYAVYLPGERVTLTCSAPGSEQVSGYRFFYQGQQDPSAVLHPNNSARLELAAEKGNAGNYTCAYWRQESNREISSRNSSSVSIPVTDPPPAPTLSRDPWYTVYLPGERVTLTCSAPGSELDWRYRFFYQGQQDPSTVQHRNEVARLELTAEKGNAGTYTCAYWRWESNREISSGNSNSVSIPVTDTPAAPTFSLSPPHQLYLTGESVRLTCSPPRGDEAVTRFQFYKYRGSNISPDVLSNSWAPNFKLKPEDSGSYTCLYWIHPSGREIPSVNSAPVSISVRDPPPAPTLSLDTRYTVYLPGERVTLTCSAPGHELASGYRFFYQKRQWGSDIVQQSNTRHWLELTAEKGNAGTYTCAYWRLESNREISSKNSNSVSIPVTDRDPAPQLTVSPQQPVYVTGEAVTLTCSASRTSTVSGVRFFRDDQEIQRKELPSPRYSYTKSIKLLGVSRSQAGVYTCESWKTVSGREITSNRSRLISIALTDPPPQPGLRLDPPSGAVSEGLPLLIICAVSRDAREWRFHFYKDGVEIVPRDMGSEISTMEPGTGSVNVSVLSIPQAGPNNIGEFTCGYEANVSGRWIPSPRSRAVNVTMNVTGTASYSTRDILLTTGGLLFLVGAIAALICYCGRKERVPKPQKSTEGSEPRGCARNLHPGHDHQGSEARVPGAEQMEQGSEVTYALMVFPTLEAQATQSKNKAKPAEDEHVLYSEVVTTHTRKAAK
ncbi:Fc receptor-like protein 5 isoform X2 [Chrysemys picta bellii]|uniref:Fc receptor-like protein 5 isoform X2 n=1 Tax=Chrysemys picta bellii TaxID=8478 RepID=UPI0032B17672